jgi:hypothetical protein
MASFRSTMASFRSTMASFRSTMASFRSTMASFRSVFGCHTPRDDGRSLFFTQDENYDPAELPSKQKGVKSSEM